MWNPKSIIYRSKSLLRAKIPSYVSDIRHSILIRRWRERPSQPRPMKESTIRFHAISINRPPSSALNLTGKRDRKLRFSTHRETHWHALFNLFRWYRWYTLIILLGEKQLLCFPSLYHEEYDTVVDIDPLMTQIKSRFESLVKDFLLCYL